MNDRMNIFPSRYNLVLMKARIVAASRGLNLLKRKRDALEMRLRVLKAQLAETKLVINTTMQEAIFSIAKANYLGADFKPASIMDTERADIFMRIKSNRVVGLSLPSFELMMQKPSSFPHTGLSRGGKQVELIREKFQEAVKQLISLASLEFSVAVLEDGMRQNNMRINGLDYVLIPRFHNTVVYIKNELEEFEREDFYRLKRSQAKQRKAKQRFRDAIRKKNQSSAQEAEMAPGPEVVPGAPDNLNNVSREEAGKDTSRKSAISSLTSVEQNFDPEAFSNESTLTAEATPVVPKRQSTRKSLPLEPVPEEDETEVRLDDEEKS